MGQVHKIGNEYYIEFYARGLLYQQKAGEDYEAAVKMLADVESKIKTGEMGTLVRDIDLDIFLKMFLDEVQEKHSVKTFKRFKLTVEYFQKFLSVKYPHLKKLSEVTPVVIENFRSYLMTQPKRQDLPIKPTLMNFTLVLLEDVLIYAIKLGYLNDNPMVHTRWIGLIPKKELAYISEDDLIGLRKNLTRESADLLEFMVLTGLSLREVQALRWEQVDLDNHCIQIGHETKKTHKLARVIPLAARAKQILLVIPKKGDKIFTNYPTELLNYDQSLIRNSFAYFALKQGVRLTELYRMMGLDDVLKVMRYFSWLPGKLV